MMPTSLLASTPRRVIVFKLQWSFKDMLDGVCVQKSEQNCVSCIGSIFPRSQLTRQHQDWVAARVMMSNCLARGIMGYHF
jgi:hypothetical protein